MVKYYCNCCDFITSRKSDFDRHQKTQKHLNNEEEFSDKAQKSTLETQKRPIKDPQKTQLTLFETQKRPEIHLRFLRKFLYNLCSQAPTRVTSM